MLWNTCHFWLARSSEVLLDRSNAPSKGPDFQYPLRANSLRQKVQELSLRSTDSDIRQAFRDTVLDVGLKAVVLLDQIRIMIFIGAIPFGERGSWLVCHVKWCV